MTTDNNVRLIVTMDIDREHPNREAVDSFLEVVPILAELGFVTMNEAFWQVVTPTALLDA